MDNYQDYVIRDGKFIGKFEEMYQKFDDPWEQIACVGDSYSRHATSLSINSMKLHNILEIGCGLGGGVNFSRIIAPMRK